MHKKERDKGASYHCGTGVWKRTATDELTYASADLININIAQ